MAEARSLLEQAAVHQEIALKAEPLNAQFREFMRNHLFSLSIVLPKLSAADEAYAAIKRFLDIGERLVRDFPWTPQYRLELADAHFYAASAYADLGRTKDAEREYRAALKRYEAEKPGGQGGIESLVNASDAYGRLG